MLRAALFLLLLFGSFFFCGFQFSAAWVGWIAVVLGGEERLFGEEAAILAHDIVCRLSRTVDAGWTMGVFGFVETEEDAVVRFDDETAEDERGFRCCTVDSGSL